MECHDLIKSSNDGITMGTREISSLLSRRHRDIMISADRLATAGVINGGAALSPTPYVNNQNDQVYCEYRLCKRDTLILVAQNCPEFTAAIIDRWQELEKGQLQRIPQTYAEALMEAGRLALEVERQSALLVAAAPKIDFVDKYVNSEGSRGFREVAKLLGVKENFLREFLISNKIMYRLSRSLMPFAQHINAGRFEIKTGVIDHMPSQTHAYQQAKFTPKGIEWLAGEIAKRNARATCV